MFDYVNYPETRCGICGSAVKEYQSKSGNCELQLLTPEELLEQSGGKTAHFYGDCDKDWNAPNKEDRPHMNDFTVLAPVELRIVRTEEL